MDRITQKVKSIADAHIAARQSGTFDNPNVTTSDEVFSELIKGKTFEEVINVIEVKYCSIGSVLMSRQFSYTSNSYKSAVYKGFKTLFRWRTL